MLIMKKLFVFLGIVFLSACSTETPQTPISTADMPMGAIEEPFEDNSEMVKVTVKDELATETASGIYVNGVREGSWVEYHPNGFVKSIIGYYNGLKEGQALELDNRGQLLERFTYHNGQLNGLYSKYSRTRVKEQKNYKNGKLEGKFEIFYDNGKVMEESYYKNDKRDGVAKWFDEEGNITIEYTYEDGEWIKDE